MTPEERQLLEGLFERTRQSAAAPRDRDAEALITDAVRAQPYAPYLLAQAVIVQEEGLKAAAARIQELEAKVADLEKQQAGAGGFLGGIGKTIFGDGGQPRTTGSGVPAFGRQAAPQQGPSGPWGAPPQQPGFGAPAQQPGFGGPAQGGMFGGGAPAGGGSFLRSAMTTAAGVAGGALLFSGIQSLFNSHGSGLMSGNTLLDQPGGGDLASSVTNSLGGAPQTDLASAESFSGSDTDPTLDDASFDDSFGDDGGDDGGGDWA